MSFYPGAAGGSDDDDDDLTGGTRIHVRGDGRSRIRVAGRDMNTSYFVSASSAALVALVGLVILLGMWQPWQEEAAAGGERNRTGAAIDSGAPAGSPTTPVPNPEPPAATEEAPESQAPEPTHTSSPSPTPSPPNPTDMAFASAVLGTCLNVYDDGWGRLSHNRPFPVDCGANYAYSKVSMVTTYAANCPQGAGRRGWGHVNADGSPVALCLDRVFAVGQCFPATLTREADGSIRSEGRLFSVWGCDRTQVPRGQNAIMVITAVLKSGGCPQRTDRQTHSWPIFNGAGTICAIQKPN